MKCRNEFHLNIYIANKVERYTYFMFFICSGFGFQDVQGVSWPGQTRFLPAGGPQMEPSGYSYTIAGCFGHEASSHVPSRKKWWNGHIFSEKCVPAEHLVFLKHLNLSGKPAALCVCVCVCSGLCKKKKKFMPWLSPLKSNCENVWRKTVCERQREKGEVRWEKWEGQ